MTISKQIKDDYITLKNFANKEKLNYRSVLNALSGDHHQKGVANRLIELGYIQNASDLKKNNASCAA